MKTFKNPSVFGEDMDEFGVWFLLGYVSRCEVQRTIGKDDNVQPVHRLSSTRHRHSVEMFAEV